MGVDYITKTLISRINVDEDFVVEISQRKSKPFDVEANITPDVKIITKTTWAKMLFCEEHQQLTMDSFICAACEGI